MSHSSRQRVWPHFSLRFGGHRMWNQTSTRFSQTEGERPTRPSPVTVAGALSSLGSSRPSDYDPGELRIESGRPSCASAGNVDPTSIWSVCFFSVWSSRRLLPLDLSQGPPLSMVREPPPSSVSDRALIALQAPIGALNTREPSGDDLASTPSASDTHPRSSRVGC